MLKVIQWRIFSPLPSFLVRLPRPYCGQLSQSCRISSVKKSKTAKIFKSKTLYGPKLLSKLAWTLFFKVLKRKPYESTVCQHPFASRIPHKLLRHFFLFKYQTLLKAKKLRNFSSRKRKDQESIFDKSCHGFQLRKVLKAFRSFTWNLIILDNPRHGSFHVNSIYRVFYLTFKNIYQHIPKNKYFKKRKSFFPVSIFNRDTNILL